MWNSVLDALFPKRSLSGGSGAWVTPEEHRAIRGHPRCIEAPTLRVRGLHSLDRVVAASSYDAMPLLRIALHRCKYGRIPALAEEMGELLLRTVPYLGETIDESVVLCPVPLHWTRRFWRGFNQAEVLARHVAAEQGWQVRQMLRRTQATGFQARRNRAERRRAMQHAFAPDAARVPARVILVDDVCTTGATLDACACALKSAGAERVDAMVVALG